NIHDVPLSQHAEALGPGDLVLAEEELDALGVLTDDFVLALEHLREVESDLAELESMLRRVLPGEREVLARRQERLRWNASDVDAGSAERLVVLHANRIEAELRRA